MVGQQRSKQWTILCIKFCKCTFQCYVWDLSNAQNSFKHAKKIQMVAYICFLQLVHNSTWATKEVQKLEIDLSFVIVDVDFGLLKVTRGDQELQATVLQTIHYKSNWKFSMHALAAVVSTSTVKDGRKIMVFVIISMWCRLQCVRAHFRFEVEATIETQAQEKIFHNTMNGKDKNNVQKVCHKQIKNHIQLEKASCSKIQRMLHKPLRD